MDREEKRLEITLEAVKQQLTLASGIVAGVVALGNDKAGFWHLIPWALTPFVLSILGGAFVLLTLPMALYGTGDPLAARGVRVAGVLQLATFIIGIIALVAVIMVP